MTGPAISLPPKTSETEFLGMVLKFASICHWRTLHIRPGMTAKGYRTNVQGDGVGFPDVLAVRQDRIVLAELKVDRNKPTPDQLLWLAAFDVTAAEVYLWTPTDWPEIERVLK